ncbi:neurogenic locus notch homolog protein 1 [Nematostella vectensis]|uniref:neurogenic locus notch homolog protein 1 n=1 Tax=Nematostella vectensis TaxID=45351 RepID=UPI00207717B7|nr:neurogenic locus notch homolog protein 1 [Nematostella vectensis]
MTLPISILLLGLVARMCHTQDPCRNMHFPSPVEDYALFNHTLQNITDISVWNCQVKCYVSQACRAVNYKKGANLGSCELLSAKAGSFPKDLLKFPGIDYYGPNEVCVPNPCPSANMTCLELKGTPRYRCECPQGYTGAACETDVNECSLENHNCHRDRATCANTIGSFACTCKPGYTGDGINCADIDECSLGSGNCHQDATCSNTAASFTCTCKQGFKGDGVSCADIDECSLGSGNCHQDAICSNTAASFTCTCKQGFKGDGVSCTAITYTHLGCYVDTSDRAIREIFKEPVTLQYCFQEALSRGYIVFAMQAGRQCFTGANAHNTYYKHGNGSDCSWGTGGSWRNDVYQINY